MSDFLALIRACKDEPDDDAPRLILADWLEEHGQPERSEFIRRQVREPNVDEAQCPYNPNWLGAWKTFADDDRTAEPTLYSFGFHRGFIRIADGFRDLYDRLSEVLGPAYDWTWLEEIRFGSWHDGDWTPLFQSERLLELNRLEFTDDDYGSRLLQPLVESPFVANLKHLKLFMVGAGDPDIERLSQCRTLSGLRSLDLTEMGIGPVAARVLARSELWDQLRSCSIRGSRIGDRGLSELAHGRCRPRLERLDLSIGEYSDAGLVELAGSDRFPSLKEVSVGYRRTFGDGTSLRITGVERLLTAANFQGAKVSVYIISDEPVVADFADLLQDFSARLSIWYKNPRQTRGFVRWLPEPANRSPRGPSQ